MQVTIEDYNSLYYKLDFYNESDEATFTESVCELIPNFNMLKKNPRLYHKFKHWDGKIRYYNKKDNLLYKGLLPNLKNFCNVYNVNLVDLTHTPVLDIDTDKFLDSLHITKFVNETNSYIDIKPDVFQSKAFHETLKHKNLRIEMATGAGKTLYSYCVVNYLNTNLDNKIVIVVPRKDLANSFYNEYAAYSKFDNSFDMNKVSVVHSESKHEMNNKILIITYQTLEKVDKDFFLDIDAIIVDEAHKAKNKSLKSIIDRSVNTQYRIGMSGTFKEKDLDSETTPLCLQALLGDVIHIVSQKNLIEADRASKFEARAFLLKHKEFDVKEYDKLRNAKNATREKEYKSKKALKEKQIKDLKHKIFMNMGDVDVLQKKLETLENTYIETVHKKWSYVDEIDFLKNCNARNKFIIDNAMNNERGNSLVVFKHIETHGDILYNMTKSHPKSSEVEILYIHGKTKLKPDVAKKIIETSKKRVVVLANMDMVKEGWSVNNLHFLYMAMFIKKPDALIQLVGRLLRKDDTDIVTSLYLFIDDFRTKTENNFSYEHGIKNIKTIKSEKHNVKTKTVNLDDYY